MGKVLTAFFFGLLLIVGAGTESAQSGEAIFKLTNNAPHNVMVKFFSQGRNHYWPGATRHYNLDDRAQHAFRPACNDGEKICYGGSYSADDKNYWNVGFQGDKHCNNCCLTCGSNVKHAWNLNEGPSNTSGGFANDTVGVPID